MENINKQSFQQNLEFNTGRGNSAFSNLTYLGDKKILMDVSELKIKGIWLYTGRIYDDLIIFETEENEPFIINGKETYNALRVNNEHIVEALHLNTGYVEIGDEVFSLSDLHVQEINRSNYYKYYFIGTEFHSSIIPENDSVLDGFQEIEIINGEVVSQVIRTIRKKKHREVSYRL
ncbi:hypothetical protein ABIE66_002494 [Peribacillus sp. B2I2]